MFARWRQYAPHLILGFVGPREFAAVCISIGSSVLAALTVVTNAQTKTHVGITRIYDCVRRCGLKTDN